MTMRVALKIDGDASGGVAAAKETKSQLTQLEAAANSVAKTSPAMASGINTLRKATPTIKLNNQQLMNMQYQMNDMAVMMASGQNPFVMIMQQGMQIGQMFGPGASVMGALKATGAGFMTFLTNPIMLTIAATAALAGGAKYMFEAFSGPEAESAEETLSKFDEFASKLENGYDDAADAIKRFVEAPLSADEIKFGLANNADELKLAYETAISSIVQKVDDASMSMQGYFADLSPEIRSLTNQLKAGEINAQEFSQKLSAMALSPDIAESVKQLAKDLVALSPTDIDVRLQGVDAALKTIAGIKGRVQQAFSLGLRERFAEDGEGSIAAQLKKQAEDILNAGKKDDRAATKAAREAERAAAEAERQATQRANNQLLLSDLEKEIAALQATGAEREFLLSQLKDEQAVRSAIASLGEEGTAAEAARLRELIPLKSQLLQQSKQQEEQMRKEEQSARGLASGLTGIVRQMHSGTSAGEIFSNMLLNMGMKLLESGLMSILGGGASAFGGGGAGLLSMLFSANGNAFSNGSVMAFANGGAFTNSVVSQPTMFNLGMMGEAGPEAIMPLKRNASGQLGISSIGGNTGAMEIRLGPDLEGRIISQAHSNSVKVVKSAAPTIAGQGAQQGVNLSRDSFSRQSWSKK